MSPYYEWSRLIPSYKDLTDLIYSYTQNSAHVSYFTNNSRKYFPTSSFTSFNTYPCVCNTYKYLRNLS